MSVCGVCASAQKSAVPTQTDVGAAINCQRASSAAMAKSTRQPTTFGALEASSAVRFAGTPLISQSTREAVPLISISSASGTSVIRPAPL